MNRRHRVVTGLLLAAVVALLIAPATGVARAQDPLPPARLRILHAVPGAPNVDVYLDDVRVASDLPFGGVTPHLTLEGQQYLVALRQAGTSPTGPTLIEVPVPLVPSLAFTVVAQGQPDAVQAALYEDILDEINPGMARLTAINAIADAPPVDVLTSEGGPLLQGVNYGNQFGTVNINTGVQSLVIVPAGGAVESALATIGDVPLRSGKLYTFVALGTLDGAVEPSALVLETSVNPPEDGVSIQVAHGSPDAGAVDVYAGDVLIAPAVTLGELTGHLPLPAGDYTLAVRSAGAAAADAPLLTHDVSLEAAGSAVTVVANGLAADESLQITLFEDSLTDVSPQFARLAVVNALPDATVSLDMRDSAGTVVAFDPAAPAQAEAVNVEPATYVLTVSVAGEDEPVDLAIPEDTYLGGIYYTVLVFGGEGAPIDAHVAATPLQVTPQSLPAVEEAVAAVVEQPAEVPAEPTAELPVEGATEIVEEAPPAESEVVVDEQPEAPSVDEESELVQTTPLPESAVTEPVAPTPAPLQAQPVAPVAYVDLNPGANLHCREYPGSSSLSLGLIPSGSTVTVIGRPGEASLPETGDPTPPPTPVIEALEEMWLAIRWEPQGGGYVTCWVAVQYLRVEWQGRLLDTLEELYELPELPFNTPGEVVGADVRPPTPVFDAIVATVELQPGVSLQLRRQPNTMGESLELVPAGAQFEIIGFAEAPSEGLVGQPIDPNWYYVRYRTENGGATVGWVSAQYVSTPTRLGRVVPLTELVVIDVTEQGYYELPGQAPVVPTEMQNIIGTVNLNPGANLNLRDQPSQDGRVVVGIPTGESMVVNGRNVDGTWVQVTYTSGAGDLEGWVASQFLQITRGGQFYDVMELPDLTGDAVEQPEIEPTDVAEEGGETVG